MRKIFVTLAIAGILFSMAPPANATVEDAMILGDSLAVSAEADFRAITTRYTYQYWSWPGTTVGSWQQSILDAQQKSLVLALGTNDAGYGPSAQAWDDILDQLPPDRCVIWPKTYEAFPYITAFNVSMEVVRAQHPNLKKVDWNAQAKQHPEYQTSDGIHHTAAGDLAYATMLKDASKKCL